MSEAMLCVRNGEVRALVIIEDDEIFRGTMAEWTADPATEAILKVTVETARAAFLQPASDLISSLFPYSAPAPNAVPDYCYDPKNWEFTCNWSDREEVHGHGDGLNGSEPMEVATLVRGPRKWVADVPVTWDEHGDPDETEIQWLDSEEEARAAASPRPEGSDNG